MSSFVYRTEKIPLSLEPNSIVDLLVCFRQYDAFLLFFFGFL